MHVYYSYNDDDELTMCLDSIGVFVCLSFSLQSSVVVCSKIIDKILLKGCRLVDSDNGII